MSLHECFERHLENAVHHKDQAAMAAEDALGVRLRVSPVPLAAGAPSAAPKLPRREQRRADRALKCALSQQLLAAREFKEAVRLRPHREEPRKALTAARATVKALKIALRAPAPQPVGRFLSHYNLAIRYWDLGKARLARDEADKACLELKKAGLPVGCAEHCRAVMAEHCQDVVVKEERRLLAAVSRAPHAVGPSYALGVHYFDKRMLLRAEAHLRWTQERARAAGALRLVELDKQQLSEQDLPRWQRGSENEEAAKKDARVQRCLEGVEDDLGFLLELKECFCVEDPRGKAKMHQAAGLRSRKEPCIVPCLHRRFCTDVAACDAWWDMLRCQKNLDLLAA